MKPSFRNFKNYIQNNDSDDEIINKIHMLLFQSLDDTIVLTKDLANYLNITQKEATEILLVLQKMNIITFEPRICMECGHENPMPLVCCENCGCKINIYDNIMLKIDGLKSEDEKKNYKKRYYQDLFARNLACEWKKNGEIYYILIDLVQSELLQHENDEFYTDVLEEFRKLVFDYALAKVQGTYLILGEIGDCIKIAFSNYSDIKIFAETFAQSEFLQQFPARVKKSKDTEEIYYPCFNMVSGAISLPYDNGKQIQPEIIIVRTLNDSMDFNSSSLTTLFRMSESAKLIYKNAFKNNHLCLWVFDKLINKFIIHGQKEISRKYGKHGERENTNAILFSFSDGKMQPINDPFNYIREQED